MIGYVCGVSSSPVAGVIASAVFGTALSVWAGYYSMRPHEDAAKPHAEEPAPKRRTLAQSNREMQMAGIALTTFSVSFIAATFAGGWVRVAWPRLLQKPPPLTLPWVTSDKPPQSADEAWRWITFSHDAAEMGLEPREIENLYKRAQTSEKSLSDPSVPAWPSYKSGRKDAEIPAVIRAP